jgi:hypothetical protein
MEQDTTTTPWAVGTEVGAKRWPGTGGRPWRGVVLAEDDPRAWTGTLAFPNEDQPPTREEAAAHVAKCRAGGYWSGEKVPVLWDFGDETRAYWERLEHLRPYADDVAAWEAAQPGGHTCG